ncbi:2-keto-4-pentenoate hydratase/2-oxohepta-3-ene-1,7-dioic acid hydratase (catechol pathway) [Sphingomonas guangdongensis]|uniref:2-keto-4-pentenoate hydratase/2-oxohepta-3-ene-1,7-dioic acid hydratase (Catechol pathway) n=1 Tax=Sphingomonas guangdongensis TaxID=1141890 RepID=A0A285QWW2_9SPHN|nr:fumarylacetoacetate hydrolase family protein [Sphingomonas guangdongensis]SOB86465.1 2-keto-4-pentenoate hydratase/2-oxohepta-3-ene-1,7-dioic acid hydratase (catechol pathway) [Sphingomonas guangdongensis]
MKLCRYGAPGAEKPGMIDADGRIRDLSNYLADIDARTLAPETLATLAGVDPAALSLVADGVRYGPPVAGTRQFVAIGLNYADHAAEANLPVPAEPVVFSKWVSCIGGPNDPVTIPQGSEKSDWEVELGVVIGTAASYVSEADALRHVAGYCVVNDVSERQWQLERGPTWDKGKGFPGFGPVGPWLVTADEVGDPQALRLWLDVNGERQQDGSTATMIFSVAQIIAYLSQIMTLLPGDIVTTGTPPGVGMGQKPSPRFLKDGDVVTLGIDGLGQQRQTFVAAPVA